MSIDKRGERSWRFRIKHKKQLYTMTFEAPPTMSIKDAEKEAEKQHMIFKADVIAGRVSLVKDITMNQLIDAVYKEYVLVKLKVNTQLNYTNIYNNYLIPEFGNLNVKDITPLHIQKFTNKLSAKLKATTIHGIISCLNKTFKFAIKWGYLEKNPCQYVEKPVHYNSNNELMSLDNIEKLVDYYINKETNLLHRAAFCLAIGCGLRNAEIRALTINDIDFENKIINVDKQVGKVRDSNGKIIKNVDTSTKTYSSKRKIYAPQFVLDAVKDHIDNMPYIPISKKIFWSHITNAPLTKECLSIRFKRILLELKLPEIRFHDLRHLQATILIQSGVNAKAVSKRMGHSKVNVTLNTYASTIDAVDQKIADDLNDTFKNLKSLS